MERDTIAAISTAQLPAGIAVLRLSGSKSIDILQKIFVGKKPLCEASSRSLIFGNIYDGDDKVDEVLVSYMKGPNSYTGEDVCEINCHGSLLVQRKILSLLIREGARAAGPGEYTMRAFMNGRMDLSQAESVMDLISSENEFALKQSLEHLSGDFSALINDVREKILYEIAFIESALDDPEHISLDGYPAKLKDIVYNEKLVLARLIKSYDLSSIIKNGIDCAIVGRVNVGKSSLLNALSHSDKAIVTDIPGTTRDAIEQKISLGNISLNIIDTAGFRETDNEIEKIGIDISRKYMEKSTLVILVIDGSKELSKEDINLIDRLLDRNAVIVVNKKDLTQRVSLDDIKKKSPIPVISISAKSLDGMDILADEIEKIFIDKEVSNNDNVAVINERHLFLLREALVSLEKVEEAIDIGMTEDLFTVDLTGAYESLGKIVGQNVGEDIINEIFSKFCIGK